MSGLHWHHQKPLQIENLRILSIGNCTFSSTGSKCYFILKPGYQSIFTGVDEGKDVKLTITVLNKTHMVNGTETRIVERKSRE